ncbi:MAG: hypothetical protein H7245_02285 [Candidatus Saccharibacteria bacterium]|nr:hypothetical protein [Pseudorhodobacter sp.]
MRAAETLARTLLPNLAVTTISARAGGSVIVEADMPPREIARRLAFMLTRAAEDPPARPPQNGTALR